MQTTQALTAFSLLLSQLPTVAAFWRLACSVSQEGRIDPILNSNQPVSGHVHKFAGGINVNPSSDYDSLQASSCSTCEVQKDKSAYWTPILYYEHADGTFVEVPNNGMTVYYLGRVDGGDGASTTPFPKGFKMISGDSRLRSYDNSTLTYLDARPIADRVNFRCITEANNLPETPGISQTDCVNGLRAQLHFPTCWNGLDLYLPGQAHVAYTSRIDNGVCPPTHPIAIPHLFFEVLYGVNDIDQSDGGRFVFANGDPTGYGFHGDFINGWDMDVLSGAVDNCLYPDLDGVAQNCPSLAESHTSNFPRICPQALPIIDERINGTDVSPLTALPGCNPVTFGPGLVPQIVCPVNSSTPASNSTSTTSSQTSFTTTSSSLSTSSLPPFTNASTTSTIVTSTSTSLAPNSTTSTTTTTTTAITTTTTTSTTTTASSNITAITTTTTSSSLTSVSQTSFTASTTSSAISITSMPSSTSTSTSTSPTTSNFSTGTTWTWVVGGHTFTFTWGANYAKRSEPTPGPGAGIYARETATTLRIKGREFVHYV